MDKPKPARTSVKKVDFEEKLKERISPEDADLVMLAYQLSKYGHKGQERDSGLRYFEHPKRVTLILIDELNIYDSDALISGLLHDIKEDSFILGWSHIKRIFGEKVLETVKILTKEETEEGKTYIKKIRKAEKVAQIIKLADRLDNLRELYWCSLEKQARTIEETEKYYLPIARRTNKYLYEKMKGICDSYKNRVI